MKNVRYDNETNQKFNQFRFETICDFRIHSPLCSIGAFCMHNEFSLCTGFCCFVLAFLPVSLNVSVSFSSTHTHRVLVMSVLRVRTSLAHSRIHTLHFSRFCQFTHVNTSMWFVSFQSYNILQTSECFADWQKDVKKV